VANSFPRNRNLPRLEDRTFWSFKATGSYDAFWGIRISPVLRHQSGVNYARTLAVPGTAGNAFGLVFPASTIYTEPADSRREQNIWVFDTRVDRTFNITERVRVRGFLDFFNISNSSAPETITRSTGANFLRPAAILAPFTVRLGGRLLW
jgi:hypothetical protein